MRAILERLNSRVKEGRLTKDQGSDLLKPLTALENTLFLIQWALRNTRKSVFIVSYDYLYFQSRPYISQYADGIAESTASNPIMTAEYLRTLADHTEGLRAALLEECWAKAIYLLYYPEGSDPVRKRRELAIQKGIAPQLFDERIREAKNFRKQVQMLINQNETPSKVWLGRVKTIEGFFGFSRYLLTDDLCFEQTFPEGEFGISQQIDVRLARDPFFERVKERLKNICLEDRENKVNDLESGARETDVQC